MDRRTKVGDIYQGETAQRYYDVFGPEIDSSSELDRFFLELIPTSLEGKFALDLGAGNGRYAELLSRRGAKGVIALDLSLSMLGQVKQRKTERKLDRLEPVNGDLENLPLSENSLDYILSRYSLMYARDLSLLIQSLASALKDDGEILIQANFAIIENPDLEKIIKSAPVPLNLKIGEREVGIQNYAHTMKDYISAFEEAKLAIQQTQQFSADELAVDKKYPHADAVNFRYVVFRLKKDRI